MGHMHESHLVDDGFERQIVLGMALHWPDRGVEPPHRVSEEG